MDEAFDADALLSLGRFLKAEGYSFVTPTPATCERVNARPDNRWAEDVRGVMGWSRVLRPGGRLDGLLDMLQAAHIAEPADGGWRSRLRASTLDGQLYFHSAFPTSAQDAVFFGPDTYRFVRALGAAWLSIPPARIIDIGAGAGPGAISLALRYPHAEVIAGDVNPLALALAGVNAALAAVANVRTVQSNVLDGVDGPFDLIICNPPYIADDAGRAYRDGGDEMGSALSRRIIREALPRLAPGGQLLLYTGSAIVAGRDRLLDSIAPVLDRPGLAWAYEEIDPDVFGEELEQPAYASAERIAAVWLSVRRD